MTSQSEIPLVTQDAALGEVVASALDATGSFKMGAVYADLAAMLDHLKQVQPRAVLVDIDPDPRRFLAALDAITTRFPETRFVVLSSIVNNELVLEAMQVGARHFLQKGSIPSDLLATLQRLLRNGVLSAPGGGKVVTVLSACGGAGGTLIAFNLAYELALENSQASLLVDLDWHYGALGPYLGVAGKYGIDDILTSLDQIDSTLIRSSAVVYSEQVHVLLSPASINFKRASCCHFDRLGDVLEACVQIYGCTVFDAPRLPMHAAAVLAAASSAILLVCQMTVKDIRLVRSIHTALVEFGVPLDRFVVVANRYDKRSTIRLEEAKQALEPLRLVAVTNDYLNAVQSINSGRPLALEAPSSVLRQDIRKLTTEIRLDRHPVATRGNG